jgi:hypothetical protein
VSLAAGARCHLYRDLNVAAEQRQEVHESLGGETGKLTPQKTRNLGLIDLEYMGGASLREPPRANGLGYADRKVGLSETLFGFRQTDVGEDVPAAVFDLNFLAHARYPL